MENYVEKLEIQKCEKRINKDIFASVRKTKLLAILTLILFISKKEVSDLNYGDLIFASSLIGETVTFTSLIKTICDIYIQKDKKKHLESELKHKQLCKTKV